MGKRDDKEKKELSLDQLSDDDLLNLKEKVDEEQSDSSLRVEESDHGTSELEANIFDKCLLIVATLMFITMLFFVVGQVFIRLTVQYTGFSVAWTEETSRYLMVLATFFGAAVAMRRNEHITITTIVERLNIKARILLEIVGYLLIIVVVSISSYGTYILAIQMINAPTGSIPNVTYGHIYGLITVALILIGVYALRWLPVRIREIYRLFEINQARLNKKTDSDSKE